MDGTTNLIFLNTLEAEGELWIPLNRLKAPVIFHITDRFKAVLLIWFYVFAYFGVSFSTFFTCCVSL